MSSAFDTVDDALSEIWTLAKRHGLDVSVYMRPDGRVWFYFEDPNGISRATARGDLGSDGTEPTPGEALLAAAHELESKLAAKVQP